MIREAITTNYQPSFVVDQLPKRFGGQQDDYIKRTNQIIDETSEKIKTARKNGSDLKKVFFEIIKDLSRQRAQIAKDHKTEDAEDFGKRRDNYYPGRISILVMKKPYKEYGDKILDLFAIYLKKMEQPDGKYQKAVYEVEETCGERISKLQFEVFEEKDRAEKKYDKIPELYLPSNISEKQLEAKDDKWTSEMLKDYWEKFHEFKINFPGDYRCRKIVLALLEINRECPSPRYFGHSPQEIRPKFKKELADEILGNMKSLHVHVTLRTQIDGKLFAMTDYFTWMYENEEWMVNKTASEHPIKRMKLCSKVMLLHQDEFLIQKTLEEISKIFEIAVTWNKETQTLKELKDTMALFCYLAAHNIRDVRGSAAETEWLERAIYYSHGIEFMDNEAGKKQMVDLEAFANPLFSQFKKVYAQMTHIKLS